MLAVVCDAGVRQQVGLSSARRDVGDQRPGVRRLPGSTLRRRGNRLWPMRQYTKYRPAENEWSRLALGGVQILTLPVYPAGMLLEPFVKHLADTLQVTISRTIRSFSCFHVSRQTRIETSRTSGLGNWYEEQISRCSLLNRCVRSARAGLWPFNTHPRNEVSWSPDGRVSVRCLWHRFGSSVIAQPISVDGSCTVEIFLTPGLADDSNTILAFSVRDDPPHLQIGQAGSALYVLRHLSQRN